MARQASRFGRRRRIARRPAHSELFLFEALESRLLLSAEIGVPIDDVQTSTPADEVLALGPDNDCYVFEDGWGTDTVTENAGEGIDALDFSAVTTDLTFSVRADGTVEVTDGTNTVTATEVEWLVGGQGINTYEFEDGATLEGILGGSGTDNLDLSESTTADLTYTVQTDDNIDVSDGVTTLVEFRDIATLESIVSSSGDDTLDLSTRTDDLSFDIVAVDGFIISDTSGQILSVDGIESIVSGTGEDLFDVAEDAYLSGTVDGNDGTDALTMDVGNRPYTYAPGDPATISIDGTMIAMTYTAVEDAFVTDVIVSAGEIEDIVAGLAELGDLGEDLQALDEFDTVLPFTTSTFGEFVGSGAVLQAFVDEFGSEFDDGSDHSSDEIVEYFADLWAPAVTDELGGLSIVVDSDAVAGFVPVVTGELQLQFVFDSARATAIELGATEAFLNEVINVDGIVLGLTTDATYAYTFGVDAAADPLDPFYIEFEQITATAGISAAGLAGEGTVGILAIGIAGGTATLAANATVEVNAGDPLSQGGLDTAIDDGNVVVTPSSGIVDLTLPYTIDAGFDVAAGFAPGDGIMSFTSLDFFAAGFTALAFDLPPDAGELRLITANELLGFLEQLAESLAGIAGSQLLDLEIPLLAGATVGDALPFGEAFTERILNTLLDFDGLIVNDEMSPFTVGADLIQLLVDDVEGSFTLPEGTYADIDSFVAALNADAGLAVLGIQAFTEESNSTRVAFRPLGGSGIETVRLPTLNALSLDSAALRYGTQIAGFDSAQRLGGLLTSAIDVPGLTILAEYEDGELRFDIAWSYETLLASLPLDFDVDLGEIGAIGTETSLNLGGALDLAFTFGVEFGQTPELVLAPPLFVPTLPTGNLSGTATFTVDVFEGDAPRFSVDVVVPAEITALLDDVQRALDQALFDIGENDIVDDRLGFESPAEGDRFFTLDPGTTITATQPMPLDGKVTFPLRVLVIVDGGEPVFGRLTEDDTDNNDADPDTDTRDALVEDLNSLLATLVGPGNTILVDRDGDLLSLRHSAGTGTVEIHFYVPEIVASDDNNRISLTAPPVNIPQPGDPADPDDFGAPDLVIDRRLEITIAGATDELRYDNPAYRELGLLTSPIRFDGVLTRPVDFNLIVNDSVQPTISLTLLATADNDSIEDLLEDLRVALEPVNTNLIAEGLTGNADGVVIEPMLLAEGGNRIIFVALENSGVTSMEVPSFDSDSDGEADTPLSPAVTEFGFDPVDNEYVNTTAAILFVEPTDGAPMLQGALTVATDDIQGNARFGFLEVNLRDSFGAITGSASLSLQNPEDADPRILLPELIENLGAGRAFFNSPELLGFTAGATAASGEALVAGGLLPEDGKLERSARFVLRITDEIAAEVTTRNITVAASATEENTSVADLVDDVNEALREADLGDVIEADAPGGFLTFSAADPSADPVTLLIPYSVFADPTVTGSLDVDLVLQPAIGGVEPVAPAIASLELNLADWLTAPPELDDADSDTGLAVNFSGLDIGFYDTLTNLSATDIVDGLEEVVDFLRTLNGDGSDGALIFALDTELPLISVSLADLLDVAGEFAPIVDAVAEDPAAGFEEVERLFRDLLGLEPASELVDLSLDLDGDGVALRVDLTFLTGVDLARAFDLDLEDLADLAGGVPELEGVLSFVGVSSSGDLNVSADANFRLSLGIALGADGDDDEDDAEGTAAGVEALGFRDGDSAVGPNAVVMARTEPSADQLTDQGIVFMIQLDSDDPVLVSVMPSAETRENAMVDSDSEIGDAAGQLSLGSILLFDDLEIALRNGTVLQIDLSSAGDIADILQTISDADVNLTAELEDGRLILTDRSLDPDATSAPSETGNPVFLRGGEGANPDNRVAPDTTDPTSEGLDFGLRIGTSNLRFDVFVPERDYTTGLTTAEIATLTDNQLRDLWLDHIETTIRLAMVDANLLAATDPAAVRVGFINSNLIFDANQTLTIWPDISPSGSVFTVASANGSLAIFDLGLFGAQLDDSNADEVRIIGFELAANVGEDQLIQDINDAITETTLASLVTARAATDGRIELGTLGAATAQTLTVQNVEQGESFVRPFLYNGDTGTGLFLDAGVSGSNLEFTAQVGPFGFYVIGGGASLEVGLEIFLEDADEDGRHYFSEGFETNDFAFEISGDADASLPLFFPTESSPIGSSPLVIDVDLIRFFQAKDPSTPDPTLPSVTIMSPDLTAFPTPTLIGMLSNPEFLVDGLDALLEQVQDALNSEVLSVTLPLVGDQLVDAGQFIADFRADVLSYLSAKLREGGLNPVTIVHEALFNIFGGVNDGDPAAVEVLGFTDGAFAVDGRLVAMEAPSLDENGLLEGEARFLITIDNDDPVLIVVDPDSDNVEPGLEGLVAAINLSFAARGVGDRVEASTSGGMLQFQGIGVNPPGRIVVDRAHAVPLDLFGLRVGGLGLLQDANEDFVVDIEDVLKSGFGLFDEYGQFDMVLGQSFVFGQSLDFDLGLPALGLALDAEVELFLDWEFDFSFGLDQDVGFYFATDAHPNAPEGPADLGPELVITGGAELVGEGTAALFGFENRDSAANNNSASAADDQISSRPLTEADFTTLSGRGTDLVFRLTLDDGRVDDDGNRIEETYFVTLRSSEELTGITDLATLVAALNVAIDRAELGGDPADVGVPGVIAVASVDAQGNQRVQLQAPDGRSLTIRGDVASAEGRLGFLVVEGIDQGVAGIDLEFNVDLTDPGASPDGKLAFSEIVAASTTFDDLLTATFDGRATLDLGVMVNFALLGLDASLLPNVSLDVLVDWVFAEVDTSTDTANFGNAPNVAFENIELDLGTFISDFAGPFLQDLGEVLEPLDFLLDSTDGLLYVRLPVISDLLGQTINIRRLVELFDTEDRVSPFLSAVEEVYYFVSLITDAAADAGADRDGDGEADGLVLRFGSLDFSDFNLRDMSDLSGLNLDDVSRGQTDVDDQIDNLPAGSARNFTSSVTSPGAGSFDFPILTDPSNILNLLLGNAADVTLVTYDLPPFGFDFDYRQRIPIYPPLFATLRGFFSATIDLGFGYDALGLSQFSVTENPLDLINGFFISDIDFDSGVDIPEVTFTGGIAAGASLDIVVASAGVEGGIDVNIFLDLSDPNMDSRVRLGELEANLILNSYNPLAIFDVSGRLDAFLSAYVEVLFGLWSVEYEIARVTLVDFDGGLFAFERAPVLAQVSSDGELMLNVGADSSSRFHGDLRDTGQTIIGRTDADGVLYLRSSAGGLEQRYDGVNRIVGDAGDGNDFIDLSAVSDIEIELHGGAGNDVLLGGSGASLIFGDEGDDRIEGNAGADELHGGEGDDRILGGGGEDVLLGNAGDDELFGGAGSDLLDGGFGDDKLFGDIEYDEVTGAALPGAQFRDEYVFSANWGNDIVIDPRWADAGGGEDIWDFTDVRGDINFRLGAEALLPAPASLVLGNIMTAESLGNSVRQEGFGIGTILGGRGGDFFDVWQTGLVEMRLDGRGGSDTYLAHAVDVPGAEQNVSIKDVGNFWDQDRLIFDGSDNPDPVLVTDQQILRFTTPDQLTSADPSAAQQSVSYRSDAPDSEDLAAFDALGFVQGAIGTELVSDLTDADGLVQLARFELSINDEPAELVVVDPDDVDGDQTLRDIAEVLNVSLEISDLDDHVEAVVEAGMLLLRAINSADQLTINPVITGPGLEVLDVFGRAGDDLISIISTPDFMAVAISGGEGDDNIFVGPWLEEIKGGPLTGPLVIQGDEGFNTLAVSDELDANDNEGTLTRDRLTGLGIGVAIEFFDIDDLSVTLGTGNDSFTVLETNAGSTSVFANGGADVIDVRSASGVVNIAGDDGIDVLSLDGSDFDSTVTLSGGADGDIVNVRTAEGRVDVVGGGGDDGIYVGSEAGLGEPGSLNAINGPLSIVGGDGEDVLNIDDTFDGGDVLPAQNPLAALTELGRMTGDAVFSVQLDGGMAVEVLIPASLGVLRASGVVDADVAMSGVLSEDAAFVVEIGDEQITVLLERDLSNVSLADLEADLGVALEFHGIDADRVSAYVETDGDDSRVVFTSLQGESLAVRVSVGSVAGNELGLVDGQSASFSNETLADLIDDINIALAEVGLGEWLSATAVELDEGISRLAFNLLDGQSILIASLNGVAIEDLGLVDNQFLQPDNVGEHALLDQAGLLRATVTGLGMGADGSGEPGIIYDTVERTNISLGFGHDEFNVRGTLAGTVTMIDSGGGDDLINVASTAPDIDSERGRLLGTLDDILGDLEIAAGEGFNTLRISDFSSEVGNAGVLDEAELIGLSPGTIHYEAVTGFMGGVDLWLGSGGDVLEVRGVRPADVTAVYLGDGDDQLTAIDANTATDGLLAVFGEDGNDRVDATDWNESLVILGDAGELMFASSVRTLNTLNEIATYAPAQGGDDVIVGGAAGDHIIGGAGNDTVDGRGGGDMIIGDIGEMQLTEAVLDRASAIMPEIAGDDILGGGNGPDTVLGGAGRDVIEGGLGNDLLFGDGADVELTDGAVVTAGSVDLFTGDSDQIAGGSIMVGAENGGDGNDVLIGGAGEDTLYGTLAEDVLIFEYGQVSFTDGLIDTIQVLGQRPLDLAASTMFNLFNGPLDEPYAVPRSEFATITEGIDLPAHQLEVSTGNSEATTYGHTSTSERSVLESVSFAFDSALLLEGSFAELDQLVARLVAEPGLRAEIVGHTDSQGTEAYNLKLSEQRVRSVSSYLVERGIDPERISTRAMGESQPLVLDQDEEAQARNRRVEVILSQYEAVIPAAGAAVIGFSSWRRQNLVDLLPGGLVDWQTAPSALPKQHQRGKIKW